MDRILEFVTEIELFKVGDLTKENIFSYFFLHNRKIIFIGDGNNNLLGIITLGDFLNNRDDIRCMINKNYHYINYDSVEKMFLEAKEIYNEFKILSDIPVLDDEKKIVGYITDNKYNLDKKSFYIEQMETAKNKIEQIQKSHYLKDEITAFYDVISQTKIYVRECSVCHFFFSLFEFNINFIYLSNGEFLKKIIELMTGSISEREKTEIIIDFNWGNNTALYNAFSLDFVYDIEKFVSEFITLIENQEFSRIIRITKKSQYQLTDFIADNGMEKIAFAKNKFLTKYLYDYMQRNHISITLTRLNHYAAMEVSCLVNGIRGYSHDCIGFTYCDLIEQQRKSVELLKNKGVSVFFVRGAVNAKLTECEEQRIKNGDRLEKLIACKDSKALELLFQDDCGDKTPMIYAEDICYFYPIKRRFENDIIINMDYESPYVNFKNGIRKTCYQPESYKNTIYFTGPCFALGSFVEDKHTIPSLLSKILLEKGYLYRVVNLGILASNNMQNLIDSLSLNEGDIMIHLIYNENRNFMKDVIDPSEAFNMIVNRKDMFFDKSVHCNRKGNEIYANVIYENIRSKINKNTIQLLKKTNIYNVFKPNFKDLHLYHTQEYLDKLLKEKSKVPNSLKVIGSIVMNSNPFTLGHKYLIEYALQNCEYLYVFVVEENKSFFSFDDRFNIVKENCRKYRNVCVVPSGNMIVSDISFPEYFQREVIRDKEEENKEINVNPVLDFRLFANYIAPVLEIKKRFIAEEPLDPVTEQYNKYMKDILSSFEIQVEEIPRKALDNGEVISASKVRKMYKNHEFDHMKKMLPDVTYHYLMEKRKKYL